MSQGRLSECVARRASEEEILLQFYRGLCCALQQPSLAFLGITTSFCRSSSNTSLDTSVSFNCLCLVLFQKRTQNFLPQSHRFLALDGTLEILSSLWSQQLPFPTFFLWSVVLPEATYAGSNTRVLPAHGWTPNPRYHSLGKLVSWQWEETEADTAGEARCPEAMKEKGGEKSSISDPGGCPGFLLGHIC